MFSFIVKHQPFVCVSPTSEEHSVPSHPDDDLQQLLLDANRGTLLLNQRNINIYHLYFYGKGFELKQKKDFLSSNTTSHPISGGVDTEIQTDG